MRKKGVPTLVILVTAIAAGVGSIIVKGPSSEYATIRSYSQIPWIQIALSAYCFGTLLAAKGLLELESHTAKALRIWALFLVAAGLAWLLPALLAPRFVLSWNDCLSMSLMFCLLPLIFDQLVPVFKWMRKQTRPSTDGQSVTYRD
jgi:hypothetical protein